MGPWRLPRSAQAACAVVLALGLLWCGYGWYRDRGGAKPSELTTGRGVARVDLNRATEAELRRLPNVGPKVAERIVAHRDANGPFRSFDDLQDVPGVGEATVNTIRPWVSLSVVRLQSGDDRREGAFAADAPADAVRLARKPPTPEPPWAAAKKIEPGDPPLDVNAATFEQLQTLPGVGKVIAGRIIEERQLDPFRSVDDLRRVRGIGVKTLEKIRPFARVAREDSR